MCALEPYSALVGLTPATILDFDELAAEDAKAQLAALAATIRQPGLTVTAEVLVGRAADQLVAAAKEFGADLVVIGSRGRGPFATTLLGSISAEVVDRAGCPVLSARGLDVRKLVVAEDGTAGAAEALDLVARLGIFRGCSATVLSVADVPGPWSVGAESPMLYGAALDSYLETVASQRVACAGIAATSTERLRQAGLAAQPTVREGAAASEIVAEAQSGAANLIVMGSRGRTGVARLVLGSVARSVLTHAPCSVLIVHGQPALARAKAAEGVLTHA